MKLYFSCFTEDVSVTYYVYELRRHIEGLGVDDSVDMLILFISEEISKLSEIDVFVRVYEGISMPLFFCFLLSICLSNFLQLK